nr:telomerase Cajal body protein 1 [Ipomoea batatas]
MLFQDGSVHIYNLQTGQWVSSFQAASDTVNGFSYHPFLPMAATSSGHRRFVGLDDSYEDMVLSGNENCLSVWSFYSSTANTDSADQDIQPEDSKVTNGQPELENLHDQP